MQGETVVNGWVVEHRRGSARALHAAAIDHVERPTIWVCEVDAPGLALGSTQPLDDADLVEARRRGIEVSRRHSGGGAVLLRPEASVWVDLLVPRSDERWIDDISRAAVWAGQLWQHGLGRAGVVGAEVHTGGLEVSPASSVICFAGLGPGEVLLDDHKIVGISQRRVRSVARFQTLVLLDWDVEEHRALLSPGLARVDTDSVPDPLGLRRLRPQLDPSTLVEALLAEL